MHEERHIYYDDDLKIEAYSLQGVVQEFPNHFHNFYVIGYIENGQRRMRCKEYSYDLDPGCLVMFNPQDNHQCAPINRDPLDYRAINIDIQTMEQYAYEITGKKVRPYFSQHVVFDSDCAQSLARLYTLIVHNAPVLEKEEAFCFLLQQLLLQFCDGTTLTERGALGNFKEIREYLDVHYPENISLEQLAYISGCSKSYLVRSFTHTLGISPYRYLQTVRLEKAKDMLQRGKLAVEVAIDCGFADQSHFSNAFKRFIGLTPNQYRQIFPKNQNRE